MMKISQRLRYVALLFCLMSVPFTIDAQQIELIPPPDGHVVQGGSFVFDRILYLTMFDSNGKNTDLFSYTANDGFVEIESPESPIGYDGVGRGYYGKAFEFNNRLYLRFGNNYGDEELIGFSGEELIRIENKESPNRSYEGNPIVYKNEVYVRYRTSNKITLSKLTSNEIVNVDTEYFMEEPFILNDLLYYQSILNITNEGLVAFDGETVTEKETFEYINCCGQGTEYFPTVIDDVVYMRMVIDNEGNSRLFKYDGNTFTQVSGTVNLSGKTNVYNGPFAHENTMYLMGLDDNLEGVLLKYTIGESSMEVVENPPGNSFKSGYMGDPFFFNDELYFTYGEGNGTGWPSLAKLNDQGKIEILLSNYAGAWIIFNDELYFKHLNNDVLSLMKYNGENFTSISPEYSYFGGPVIYNDNLYVVVNPGDGNGNVLGRVIDTPLSTPIDVESNLYPNPASDHIFINTERQTSITIIDTLGKEVLNGISNEKIDISSLKSGVYFVQYEGGETLKLIKE